jgi:hypothetical protein
MPDRTGVEVDESPVVADGDIGNGALLDRCSVLGPYHLEKPRVVRGVVA